MTYLTKNFSTLSKYYNLYFFEQYVHLPFLINLLAAL